MRVGRARHTLRFVSEKEVKFLVEVVLVAHRLDEAVLDFDKAALLDDEAADWPCLRPFAPLVRLILSKKCLRQLLPHVLGIMSCSKRDFMRKVL